MAEIDTLEVKIKANAQSAAGALTSLANALDKVQKSLSGVDKDGVKVTQQISKSINDLNNALNGFNISGATKLNAFADSLNKYAEALERINKVRNNPLAKVIKDVGTDLSFPTKEDMADQPGGTSAIDQATESLRHFNEEVDKAKTNLKDTNQHLEKTNTMFDKLWNSLKRIAFYRMIRTVLKDVGDAFETGLKNAYEFSKQTEGFTRLADTLDRIKSINSQLVNQIGAMWGEIQQLLLPAVEWIVENLRRFTEWLTEFFAALNGEHTYLYAKYVQLQWDEATDSLKEYKRQLLSLDELNVLTEKNGKTDKDKDKESPYELKHVNDDLFDFATRLKNLTITIGDLLFDWSPVEGMTVDQMEALLLPGLGALAGGLIGGVPGAIVGTIAGVAIKLMLDKFLPSEGDKNKYNEVSFADLILPGLWAMTGAIVGLTIDKGTGKGAIIGFAIGAEIGFILNHILPTDGIKDLYNDETKFGDLLVPGLLALTGTLVGWTAGGVKGAVVGLTIGSTLGLILNEFLPSTAGREEYGKQDLFDMLSPALAALAGGVIGWELGKVDGGVFGGVKGALVGMSIGATLGLIINRLGDFEDQTGENKDSVMKKVRGVLNKIISVTSLGILGWKIGKMAFGITGGVLGLTTAVALSLIMNELGMDDGSSDDENTIANKLVKTLAKVVVGASLGAALGFFFTGSAAGALIGMNIGVSLTLLITNIDFENLDETVKNAFPGMFYDKQEIKTYIGQYQTKAGGGVVPRGTLFLAGEQGPEYIGSMGGTSAVANTDQMEAAIYKAAYAGMSQALRENGGNGVSGYEPATGDDVFLFLRKKASDYNKRTGNSAFA